MQLLKTRDQHVVVEVFNCESLCIVRVGDGDVSYSLNFYQDRYLLSVLEILLVVTLLNWKTVIYCVLCSFCFSLTQLSNFV